MPGAGSYEFAESTSSFKGNETVQIRCCIAKIGPLAPAFMQTAQGYVMNPPSRSPSSMSGVWSGAVDGVVFVALASVRVAIATVDERSFATAVICG
jgi:hypothetical protein